MKRLIPFLWLMCLALPLLAQENTNTNKFRQLYDLLPTPNTYRTASGAPGHEYWQQRADYDMKITLDDEKQQISGTETITYHNNSPDVLNYLWVQLDQNIRAKDSERRKMQDYGDSEGFSFHYLGYLHYNFDGGFKLQHVKDAKGNDLPHTINYTMMRIDLPEPLKPGEKFTFQIKWWYNINDRAKVRGRSGMEYFPDDDNYVYVIAQFYPRMAVYNDAEGWQNKQFIGQGEFTVGFGNFDVEITVPSDHIVSATGELQNPAKVLTEQQHQRLEKAKKSDKPVFIVDEKQARKNEKQKAKGTKTWKFKAQNVRDFAFASSRKFIWDAMGVPFGERRVLAMSFYPKEGNPLWEEYSTRVVAHTLKVYSEHTFEYPYPVAQSIHAANIGMEYPMICFNGGRPRANGKYDSFTKNYMISVIVHEIGHNFFPMIVNSDERQWTWMDEGLNTFVQYLTEVRWDEPIPSWAGPPHKIVPYMKSPKNRIVPIMSNSESLLQFSENAYYKPTAALNILRETIMGKELFDFALKEYARRWKFKHPTPADFFRTMEDASGVDLDWFWRGWFYTTDYVDIAIENAAQFKIAAPEKPPESDSPLAVEYLSKKRFENYYADEIDNRENFDIENFYYVKAHFKNIGGLIMPIVIGFEFEDGSIETHKLPAEIWRKNNQQVSHIFVLKNKVKRLILDPELQTADCEQTNNYFPPKR